MDDVTDRIGQSSHRLAVAFMDDSELPARLKKSGRVGGVQAKRDSQLEQGFNDSVETWTRLINRMLKELDEDVAWRFIDTRPKMDEPTGGQSDRPGSGASARFGLPIVHER